MSVAFPISTHPFWEIGAVNGNRVLSVDPFSWMGKKCSIQAMRCIYALALMTLIPAAGALYHTFQVLNPWAHHRVQHLKSAGYDLAVAIMGTLLLYVAVKIAMTFPAIISQMKLVTTADEMGQIAFNFIPLAFGFACAVSPVLMFTAPPSTMFQNDELLFR